MNKQDKTRRVLDIYTRLCEGKIINKAEEAQNFGVNERSIQRDLKNIRTFLEERKVTDVSGNMEYDRYEKGHKIDGRENALISNSEILAVSKILLESRAFTKDEIDRILDKIVSGCVPKNHMKLVSDLIANEKFHYVEIHHKSYIKDRLWTLGMEIEQCNLLEITYQKMDMSKAAVRRVIQPLALLFSEYYFYLNANIVEQNEKGMYVQKFEYPAVFRIDRIIDYKRTGEKFKIKYSNRFEEGEFRKRIQFMYMGKLVKLQFRYTGTSLASILERLPTARVISESQGEWIIEAEVYGRGVLMWLLTQGDMVEVLRPKKMREEMKEMLMKMLSKYER